MSQKKIYYKFETDIFLLVTMFNHHQFTRNGQVENIFTTSPQSAIFFDWLWLTTAEQWVEVYGMSFWYSLWWQKQNFHINTESVCPHWMLCRKGIKLLNQFALLTPTVIVSLSSLHLIFSREACHLTSREWIWYVRGRLLSWPWSCFAGGEIVEEETLCAFQKFRDWFTVSVKIAHKTGVAQSKGDWFPHPVWTDWSTV